MPVKIACTRTRYMPAVARWRTAARVGATVLLGSLLGGCASTGINAARNQFYSGRLTEASASLSEIDDTHRDSVLILMERGMIQQARGDYPASIRDWLDAAERIRQLDYVRLSEKASSLVINDRTETYTGKPYERALLHAFTAKSYFALGQWREAAVEARLITDGFENLNGFPDDAYSRYVAGLAFEMIRDFNGSRLEYTRADALTPALRIDPGTGRVSPTNAPVPTVAASDSAELVCLLAIGNASSSLHARESGTRWGGAPYAEFFHEGRRLGRSYTLNTTAELAARTEQRIAVIKAAKTVGRIVIKESIANAVADNNALLGEILRLLLFALEMPDTRCWETLPLWLQVARVPCPPDMESFEVVIRNAAGRPLRQTVINAPLMRSDGKIIAILRAW